MVGATGFEVFASCEEEWSSVSGDEGALGRRYWWIRWLLWFSRRGVVRTGARRDRACGDGSGFR